MKSDSKTIIKQANKRLKDLEHKGFDRSSFKNGYIEGAVFYISESAKDIAALLSIIDAREGSLDAEDIIKKISEKYGIDNKKFIKNTETI